MLAHVFRQVQKFQQSTYAFADVPQLQKILSTDLFVMRQDRELYKYSNSCEPPQKSYAARMTLNMSYPTTTTTSHNSNASMCDTRITIPTRKHNLACVGGNFRNSRE